MARFPTRENDIYAAASELWHGLFARQDIFPDPPVGVVDIRNMFFAYEAKATEYQVARSAEKQAQAAFRSAMAQLQQAMRRDYTWAEGYVENDADKLALLNWGPRKKPEPETVPETAAETAPAAEAEVESESADDESAETTEEADK